MRGGQGRAGQSWTLVAHLLGYPAPCRCRASRPIATSMYVRLVVDIYIHANTVIQYNAIYADLRARRAQHLFPRRMVAVDCPGRSDIDRVDFSLIHDYASAAYAVPRLLTVHGTFTRKQLPVRSSNANI